MSILKQEKETLQNSEKRAFDEVRSLSERVHRLQVFIVALYIKLYYTVSAFYFDLYLCQVSLDTIKSTEEVHEVANLSCICFFSY